MIEEPPSEAIPPLHPGQRLYICRGKPWEKALRDMRGDREVWDVDHDYRAGDWILSYLSTQPRVFLCWEQASEDGSLNGDILVDHDKAVYFSNLVVVDDIERSTGLHIRVGHSFDAAEAQRIRRELVKSLRHPRPWHGIREQADIDREWGIQY